MPQYEWFLQVRLDPSGIYAATVCTNRNVYIVDVATGECAAVLTGQSDNITDVAFSTDCRLYFYCIFSFSYGSTDVTNHGDLKGARKSLQHFVIITFSFS